MIRNLVFFALLPLLAACGTQSDRNASDDGAAPPATSTSAPKDSAAGDDAGQDRVGPLANAAQSSTSEPAQPGLPDDVSACLIQDGKRLSVAPLHAVGTEPFWAAEIEGRCVTYSHPENIDGTRVWTQYSPLPGGGGTWSGALQGKKFELTARAQADCSDGMSDKRYPYAVDLLVGGERRHGCAERKARL